MLGSAGLVVLTEKARTLAERIAKDWPEAELFSTHDMPYVRRVRSLNTLLETQFHTRDVWIFVCSLSICVRSIAPFLRAKDKDPVVLHLSENGTHVQAVLGAHRPKTQRWLHHLTLHTRARILPTTLSEEQGLWALDALASQFGWQERTTHEKKKLLSLFAQRKPTLLVLQVKDKGTEYLIRSVPSFVDISYEPNNRAFENYALVLYVGYLVLHTTRPLWSYFPKCLALGSGCNKGIGASAWYLGLEEVLARHRLASEAVAGVATTRHKREEPAFLETCRKEGWLFKTFHEKELDKIPVPHPSLRVKEEVGSLSVAEAASACLADDSTWLMTKQKQRTPSGQFFTCAVSLMKSYARRGRVAMVGAGVGQAHLTLRGQSLLQSAQAVLYAGSLIHQETLKHASAFAELVDSSSMTLEAQCEKMEHWLRAGKRVVRLHSGDPSLYGAIHEQMAFLEQKGYDYEMVPGISAFQAAAAKLKCELTVPNVVQTVVLSRGEGNTPMPKHEDLTRVAALRATLCLFLSASLAKKVQQQLLTHYPPETPLAVLYRLGEKDEAIHRDELKNLAKRMQQHKYRRSTLIMVGEALRHSGSQTSRSWLYDPQHYHVFRKKSRAQKSQTKKSQV